MAKVELRPGMAWRIVSDRFLWKKFIITDLQGVWIPESSSPTVPDIAEATKYLKLKGINTCDELEKIPNDMHWIMDPEGTVFVLSKQDFPNNLCKSFRSNEIQHANIEHLTLVDR